MGISKLFYRAPVYKFSRFDLPIHFDYPADLFLITKVISTFKMQFILSQMLVMGFFRDSGQPPALNILELLAGSLLALPHQANTRGSSGTRGCGQNPCSLKPLHMLVAAKNWWPALCAAPAVYTNNEDKCTPLKWSWGWKQGWIHPIRRMWSCVTQTSSLFPSDWSRGSSFAQNIHYML